MNDSFSFESLQRAIESVRHSVYYAATNYIPDGEMYRVPKTEFYPEYYVFSKNDFERVRTQFPFVRFIPLSEYKPDKQEMLGRLLKMQLEPEHMFRYRFTSPH